MPVVTQLTVWTENRPGRLAEVAQGLGTEGESILALWAGIDGDRWVIRMILDDPAPAKEHMEQQGWEVTEERVLAVPVTGEPGSLGGVARKLEDAGMNIEYAYTSRTDRAGRVSTYFAVGDVESAARALGESAEQTVAA